MPEFEITYAAFMGSCIIEAENEEMVQDIFENDPGAYVDPDGDEFFILEIKEKD